MTQKEYRAWLAEHDFIGVAHRKKHEREAAQAAEKQIKPMDTTSKTKKCKVCGKELPIEEFSKHAMTKDGYHTTCKGCMAVKREAGQLAKAEKIVSPEALKPQLEATTCDIGDIPDWILKSELERRGYIVKIFKEIHL